MKKFLFCMLLFFGLSLALSGSFTAFTVAYCGVIAVCSAFIVVFVFKFSFPAVINPWRLLVFFLCLTVAMYKSAFKILFLFVKFRGKLKTKIQSFPLKIQKGISPLLTCQSISLTPGSISIYCGNDTVSVLKFYDDEENPPGKFDA